MSKLKKPEKKEKKAQKNTPPKWIGIPSEFELLVEMYRTLSPSHDEVGMVKLVLRELNNMRIPYNVDDELNIYRIKKNTPLVCAHMDQVGNVQLDCVFMNDKEIHGTHNLGADDKNGCFILLHLIKKFRQKVSFIFSTGEESGGNIQDLLVRHQKTLKTIKYGLVFDRKGGSDIIGFQNEYCTTKFEDRLKELAVKDKFPHRPAKGVFSDCNRLKKHISCVNISCGYQKAHSDNEYTVINDVINGYLFGVAIIENIKDHYKKYDPPVVKYQHHTHPNYHGRTWSNGRWVDRDGHWRDNSNKVTHNHTNHNQLTLPGVQKEEVITDVEQEEHSYPFKDKEQSPIGNYCPFCLGDNLIWDDYTEEFGCEDCFSYHEFEDLIDIRERTEYAKIYKEEDGDEQETATKSSDDESSVFPNPINSSAYGHETNFGGID